ncbi:MAG TPA: acyl-CoA dehydrogenase family protein [Gammaproteobacteria bacterium]|nr:acyl-CoA dehydrogenase family protein [Gammaproteobacteria bacterium]
MIDYQAPLTDMQFVLEHLVGERLAGLAPFAALDRETIGAVLQEAARLVEAEIAPLNAAGDRQGCRLQETAVQTPAGFPAAYQAFVDGGWQGLSLPEVDGGQGLPYLYSHVLMDMLAAANSAFSLYPMLTQSACEALRLHGSEALRDRYLATLTSGRFAGTMCLTEPQAGSDLSLIRTRAEPDGADAAGPAYRLTGTKIFITGGEQDLSENIVHMVLARLPDAPAGVEGISLFLVPKLLPDGERNAVYCRGLEQKMGIHGASTCVMGFEGARGWLVGEANRGLRHMFTMMNLARLAVGSQGLGIAEAAAQRALGYARERLQGRPGKGQRTGETVPIVAHAEVRRMLLRLRTGAEGARMLAYDVAAEVDVARHHADPARREQAAGYVELMTPICKAGLTDIGLANASLAVQVYGGHGYIRDNGVEQLLRDAKINCLYEGTNGIQAIDLVARKLRLADGALPEILFRRVAKAPAEGAFAPLPALLAQAREVTARLQARLAAGEDVTGLAYPYLEGMLRLALAGQWSRAQQAAPALAPAQAARKQAAAVFFARTELARARAEFEIAAQDPAECALADPALV